MQLQLGFPKWKWSSYVQVALGKMASSTRASYGGSQYGNGRHVALGKMTDFGERKENCLFSGLAA